MFSKRNRLVLLAVIAALLMGLFVAGCGQTTDDPDPVNGEPTGPKEGGTLTIAVGGTPVSLDATLQRDWVTRQGIIYMYDALVYIDGNEDIKPNLATEWSPSEDGLTWVFQLRDDVLFHDGTKFNAEAVKYNYDLRIDPDGGAMDYGTLSQYIGSVEVVSEYEVQFNLKRVEVHLLEEMSWSGLMISPTAHKQHGEDFAQYPAGTGAFKFKSFEPDSHIEYVRFDDYWGGAPLLDGLTVRIIPEASARLIELEAGNVDMAYTIDSKDVGRLQDAGIVIESRTTASQQMLSVNLAKEPTDEFAVRKAIALGVDRDIIIDQILYGMAEKSRAGSPSVSPYYHADVKMFEHDAAAAAQVLDDAGWVKGSDGIRYRDGKPLAIDILTDSSEVRVLISQVVQEQLGQMGFDASVVTMEWGAYLDAMRAGDFHISYWSLAATAHRSSTGTANLKSDATWNVSQISDQPELAPVSARIDEIIDEVSITVDNQTRFNMMKEFQELNQEYLTNIWLWHVQSHSAVQPWVQDYEKYHYNVLWVQNAWLDR